MFVELTEERYQSVIRNATAPYQPKQNLFRVLMIISGNYLIDAPMGAVYLKSIKNEATYISPDYSYYAHDKGDYMWVDKEDATVAHAENQSNKKFTSLLSDN